MSSEPIRRSNPPSIRIEDVPIFRELAALGSEYRLIRDEGFVSIGVEGPPGLGKTYLAESILGAGRNRVISVRAHAANLPDVLYRYRHDHFILLWDDTNFIFDSSPSLNLLNIAIDPRRPRLIPDNRKNVGHGTFLTRARHVFLTNKTLLSDPDLSQFDKNMREMIRPLKSRFHLRRILSSDPIGCFHYACWLATDGAHLLRNMRTKDSSRSLSVDESNELLDWYAQNAAYIEELSPRNLLIIAEYRLRAPRIWESLAQTRLMTTPRTETVLIGKEAVQRPIQPPPAWTIRVVPREERAVKGVTLPTPPAPAKPPAKAMGGAGLISAPDKPKPAKKAPAKAAAPKKAAPKKAAPKKPTPKAKQKKAA